MSRRIFFEVSVIEVRDLGPIHQDGLNRWVVGNGFPYFWDAVLNVDVSNMQHVYGFQNRLLDLFQRLKKGEEEELDVFFCQGDSRCLHLRDIGLQMTVIAILWNNDGLAIFLITVYNLSVSSLGFVEAQYMRVDFSSFINFDFNNSVVIADCQIGVFVEVLVFVPVLLESYSVLSFFLRNFIFLLHLRVQWYLRRVFLTDSDEFEDSFVFREG